MLESIFYNDFTYIIIDIALGSALAFFGIILYGKTKKIGYILFVLTSIFLYIQMVFRVLADLNIFALNEFLIHGIPIYDNALIYFPYFFMTIGFIVLLFEK